MKAERFKQFRVMFIFMVVTMFGFITLSYAQDWDFFDLFVENNIGLGTTNPQAALHIKNNGYANILFEDSDNNVRMKFGSDIGAFKINDVDNNRNVFIYLPFVNGISAFNANNEDIDFSIYGNTNNDVFYVDAGNESVIVGGSSYSTSKGLGGAKLEVEFNKTTATKKHGVLFVVNDSSTNSEGSNGLYNFFNVSGSGDGGGVRVIKNILQFINRDKTLSYGDEGNKAPIILSQNTLLDNSRNSTISANGVINTVAGLLGKSCSGTTTFDNYYGFMTGGEYINMKVVDGDELCPNPGFYNGTNWYSIFAGSFSQFEYGERANEFGIFVEDIKTGVDKYGIVLQDGDDGIWFGSGEVNGDIGIQAAAGETAGAKLDLAPKNGSQPSIGCDAQEDVGSMYVDDDADQSTSLCLCADTTGNDDFGWVEIYDGTSNCDS